MDYAITATTIEVIWDDRDPETTGWAWWAYAADGSEIDSGPIRGRQTSVRPSRARIIDSVTCSVCAGADILYPDITGRQFCG